MANHLANQTSPYLLQHVHNPVDWFPWGDEALTKARAEDKPIFLSIGYSACHWCHVMAHESFEDDSTARMLNESFVSIKVDREERPDLDRVYMSAVVALTGAGGWPMSVFLSPDGKPFYGGTYFPPTPRAGMPSFTQVLRAVVDAWRNRRQDIISSGKRVVQAIEEQRTQPESGSREEPRLEMLVTAFETLQRSFDSKHGGWGDAPKFPQPMVLEFLLGYHHVTGDVQALRMVTQTLEAMARGGVYDHLGGGFHRYSVDEAWTTPHFEKMLYDQALLARVYLHAWLATGEPLHMAVVRETLDYVAREMTDPDGGFYSTQDADSEGEEGKFYLWTAEQVRDVLRAEADPFLRAYAVTARGTSEATAPLRLVGNLDQQTALADARRKLLDARRRRVNPGRDDKVLASWNGLMLGAFAEAARALGREDYLRVAERNASFLLSGMRRPDGRLWHVWKRRANGGAVAGEATVSGYLEDYSNVAEGLLTLYQTAFDERWYRGARELVDALVAHFSAPDGGFYDTADDHEALIVRTSETQDNATPSGNSTAATVLQRLSLLALDTGYASLAEQSISRVQAVATRHPLAFGQWLSVLAWAVSRPLEIAIVGDPQAADTKALLAICNRGFRPHMVVALGKPRDDRTAVPLLLDRPQLRGRATAYVCTGSVCQPPVTDPEGLVSLLERTPPWAEALG